MGKGKSGKSSKRQTAADDDDALLNAAIAENREIKERTVQKAAAATAAIVSALDKLPVFTVANSAGQPLEFKIGKRHLAVFYADVAAAKVQKAATKQHSPDCDLIAVGLGSAYKLSYDGKAMIVPGLADLVAAGAPADAQPMGQELPLFMCPKLSRYVDGSGLVVPFFMSHADCAAVAAAATNEDAPDDAQSPITPVALQSVVDQLADPASPALSFVAPSSSVKHVEQYRGNGLFMRVIDEGTGDQAIASGDDDVPPLA